jgi:hypothetical protein
VLPSSCCVLLPRVNLSPKEGAKVLHCIMEALKLQINPSPAHTVAATGVMPSAIVCECRDWAIRKCDDNEYTGIGIDK